MRVGFVSLSEASKCIYDDAVRRFCKGNNISMLTNEERELLKNCMYRPKKSFAESKDAVKILAQKYDCLFIDEILPESYHSD